MGAASLLHLLSLPRIRWSSSTEDDDKVNQVLPSVEILHHATVISVLYSTSIFHW
jgi:hypothetical protein